MNIDEHQLPTGGQHYSGRNRIPNVHEFMAQLDKEKRERDAALDAEDKKIKQEQRQHHQNGQTGDAKAHAPEKDHRFRKRKTKTVRDPVTGKDVEIENANEDFKEVVENPQVCYLQPHISLD